MGWATPALRPLWVERSQKEAVCEEQVWPREVWTHLAGVRVGPGGGAAGSARVWPTSSACSVVEGVSRRLHGLRVGAGELRGPLPPCL